MTYNNLTITPCGPDGTPPLTCSWWVCPSKYLLSIISRILTHLSQDKQYIFRTFADIVMSRMCRMTFTRYFRFMESTVQNIDCMIGMKNYPDQHFDLAIVDPEFGIGIGNSPRLVTDKGFKAKSWDDKPINPTYFTELFRVSKQQIIWGGNYYQLPGNKHCIIWDKMQPETLSFGMFDYAWTSFDGANKIFRRSVQLDKDKIHPTQKPVQLYRWQLKNYAQPGWKILDTHLGSGSSRIAAHDMGFDFTGFEIDKDYFDAAEKRFQNHIAQLTMTYDGNR